MMAQNYQAGENINIRYAGFCLSSDSCDSESDSDSYNYSNSESDSDSESDWLRFNFWSCFMMA